MNENTGTLNGKPSLLTGFQTVYLQYRPLFMISSSFVRVLPWYDISAIIQVRIDRAHIEDSPVLT